MLFNSIEFLIFIPLVFVGYWLFFKKSITSQNVFLLITSYVFYGWWDYRFLLLIIGSTLLDYFVGRQLKKTEKLKHRKILLILSLVFNLGMLGFFKYANFFIDSWVTAWQSLGVEMNTTTLNLILPVGISFYTFQTLSYTIDVYKKKLEPVDNLVQFGVFVAFFPQLVAGPIERAKNLLPQFKIPRKFDADLALSGFYLMVWGLFKKVVIADNCAFYVDQIFNSPQVFSSAELFLGTILFAMQIYGDFSGYSDIAIGVARLFGFSLMLNFRFPYFSRDIAEFWRRWHISLSTWFRDYLYIPLGGSRGNMWHRFRNVFLVFLISGLWHGANWTFVFWGAIHALLFIPLMLTKKNRVYVNSTMMNWSQSFRIITTFFLVCLAWIFFRADSLPVAYSYLQEMWRLNSFDVNLFYKTNKNLLFSFIIIISLIVMLGFELKAAQKEDNEVRLQRGSSIFVLLMIVFMGVFKNPSEFIYFQF